jgi:DNA-binding LytR/AlgR family response regulator
MLDIPNTISRYTNPVSLIDDIGACKNPIDIVMLDIKLKDTNGIDVARHINGIYPQVKVIFLTSHIAYAQDIFDAEPVYFLSKPIAPAKLENAIVKAASLINKSKSNILSLKSKGQLSNIQIEVLDYIMSNGRELVFFYSGKKASIYARLDEYEDKLAKGFLRCHKSYLVNMKRIKSFNKQTIELYSNAVIPVSKNKLRTAKASFLDYLGEAT